MTTNSVANSLSLHSQNQGVVGITDYAQQLLGDVVFVELPPMDAFVSKGGIHIHIVSSQTIR